MEICCSIREGDAPAKKRVEDVMPIATGLEREELEAELEVRLDRARWLFVFCFFPNGLGFRGIC